MFNYQQRPITPEYEENYPKINWGRKTHGRTLASKREALARHPEASKKLKTTNRGR